tara:strand:- start:17241 stop:17375 length:135 start_codon:yes stop_codon:yes gene_type:complete
MPGTGNGGAIFGTDDMYVAPSIYIIKELVRRGAKIKVYDPKAMS